VQLWPYKLSQLLVNGHITPTLPHVIKLLNAVILCAWPAAPGDIDPSSSSSSSSSTRRRMSNADIATNLDKVACEQALREAVFVAGYFSMQAVRGAALVSIPQKSQLLSTVASDDLLMVLLADLGFLCQQLHVGLQGQSPWAIDVSNSSSSSSSGSSIRSRSSSSTTGSRGPKQQMVTVPPYHKHLLAALNIGCAEDLNRGLLKPMAIDLMAPTVLLQLLISTNCAKPTSQQQPQQHSDDSNGQQQQQQQRQQQAAQLQRLKVPAPMMLPLLLCSIELPLLAPGPFSHPQFDDGDLARAALLNNLEFVATLVELLICSYPFEVTERVLMHAVGPILWLLAPAVRQQLGLMAGKRKQQQQRQQEQLQQQQRQQEQLQQPKQQQQQQQQEEQQEQQQYGAVDKQRDEQGLMLWWSQLMYWIAEAAGKLAVPCSMIMSQGGAAVCSNCYGLQKQQVSWLLAGSSQAKLQATVAPVTADMSGVLLVPLSYSLQVC
jgi:hypothetical protein